MSGSLRTCGRGDSVTELKHFPKGGGISQLATGMEAVGGGFRDFRGSREWDSLKCSRDPRTSDCLGPTGRLLLCKFL